MMGNVAEPDLGKTNIELINFRLDQLQLASQAINAQLASLSTQLSALHVTMSEKFMTRLEFAEVLRQKELQQVGIDRHLEALDVAIHDEQEAQATRGWGLAGALGMAVISLVIGALGLVQHVAGK